MKAIKWLTWLCCAIGFIIISVLPAAALNIVLTNDDGFESDNIQALFNALEEVGHDVIMSAPYLNQSGSSSDIGALVPIRRTPQKSTGGLITAGAPGVGPTTIADDQYYVNGSPVDALLYGLDVLAVEKWGKAPDLVIAGPNNGNNLGLITVHSGTVGAVVTAINRGIPAIAVSAYVSALNVPITPEEAEINARLTVRLLDSLAGDQGPLLPLGYGLNVNLPKLNTGQEVDAYEFAVTQIGMASDYGPKFYPRLRDNAYARQYLPMYLLRFPGVSAEVPYTLAGYPEDGNPKSEYNAFQAGVVTVSVIQGTYQAAITEQVQSVISKLR